MRGMWFPWGNMGLVRGGWMWLGYWWMGGLRVEVGMGLGMRMLRWVDGWKGG